MGFITITNFDLYACVAFAIIIPYLICSINPAIIVTKIKSGEDIRKIGSGGAGLTNTLRTQGKTAALFVLLGDVLKGVISVITVMSIFRSLVPSPVMGIPRGAIFEVPAVEPDAFFYYICVWIASLASVLGHCFPVYYKFKGGKAILVTVATGLVINWLAALLSLSVFIIIVLVTKYVSLGSIISAALYPLFTWLAGAFVFENTNVYIGVIFTSVIAVILIFMHRKNIKRLLNKTEKKLGQSERKR